ncbi:MAG: ATP-binding protein [Planctomycetes bacterium]|nr:ATP-binding protein [Planctomycetota bacterium]
MSRSPIEIHRALKVTTVPNPLKGSSAAFLWGPRQTGKSTLLRQQFPEAKCYDLLDTALCAELALRPRLLREEVLAARPATVILDEVQKVPELLEEVHWLLENTATRFILCGSSARNLRRKARNLLGGRAVEHRLLPLTTSEVPDLDLDKALNHGGLPVHYLAEDPAPLLRAYVNLYIKEEIIDESLTQNVPAFARFLQVVGLTHGQQLNYANIARESGVAASTVRNYFQILEDTLLGFELEPWRRTRKRRLVETSKYFLFDIGVANHLHPEATRVTEGSDLYGRAFEHFLLNEVRAYLAYRKRDKRLAYWRTSSGFEVDLIVGDMELALELKARKHVRAEDLKGLRALMDEHGPRRKLIVAREERPRTTEDGIEVVPWREFCARLWAGDIV